MTGMLWVTAIVVTIGLLALAKRRRASKGRTVYLPFDKTIVLSTGADNAVQVQALQTLAQDFEVYGIRAMITSAGTTAGEAPIEIGWCQSQLTGAEIVEQRDAAPTSQWDVTANEQSKRKVRVFGTTSGLAGGDSLNNGKYIWRRMFLRVPAGQVVADLWEINRSGAQLTTGQSIHFQGDIVGRWR